MRCTRLLVAIVIGYCPITGFCQKLSHEFGIVGKDDFDYSGIPFDPEANAVVLFDIGETRFELEDNALVAHYERTTRIKILSREGLDEANVAIPYYTDGYGQTEVVKNIEGVTYTLEDGVLRRSAVDPSQIFDENVSDKWKVKKFTFNNAQEGAILDLKYTLDSPFLTNLHDWKFQREIPTLYSKYVIRLVPFYEYAFLLQGANHFDHYDSQVGSSREELLGVQYREAVHTFVMENVQAFTDESYITSADDYIMKVSFQCSRFNDPRYSIKKDILTTWQDLITFFENDDDFGKYERKSEKLADNILKAMPLNANNPEETIKAIVEYVKANYRWDNKVWVMADKSPKDVYQTKSGNSAELNLFLVGLLRTAGLDAYPVIISTRAHGKIKYDYPFRSFFNNVLVLVRTPDLNVLTDATSGILPFDRIPDWCINERGLVVDNDEITWLDLTPGFESTQDYTLTLDCDIGDEVLDVGASFRYTEYEAFDWREEYHDTADVRKTLLDHALTSINTIRLANEQDIDKPLSVVFKGTTALQRLGETIITPPFLDFAFAENPLKQESRSYPVDLIYKKSQSYTSIITVPEGYSVETLPANAERDDGLVKIQYSTQQLGDKLKVMGNIEFEKAMYPPQDYKLLKSDFDFIVSRFNEFVVLKKNS